MDARTKRDFCFGDWIILSGILERSKIGPRPLLEIMIQKWGGGRFELSFIYIDIQLQFGQIPMTAVAV